eukprot:7345202-Alexandrium_andersonii.AAC.1
MTRAAVHACVRVCARVCDIGPLGTARVQAHLPDGSGWRACVMPWGGAHARAARNALFCRRAARWAAQQPCCPAEC